MRIMMMVVMVGMVGFGSLSSLHGAEPAGTVRRQEYQWSPLHWAVRYNEMDTARGLASGRNLEAQDVLGRTPLHLAAMFGLEEMVALLLERGADVNARDQWGVTPLYRLELVTRYRGWDLAGVAAQLRAAGGVKMDMRGLQE